MLSALHVVRSPEEGSGVTDQPPEFTRSSVLSASSNGFRSAILIALAAGLSSCSWLQRDLTDRANSTIVRRDALLEANGWIPTPPLGGPSGIGDIFSQRRGEFPTPELSDCFANEPTPHDRPNVDMNLTLETGVSVPFDEEELADAGLDGSGSRYESHVTFTDPTHWVMSRLDADLTEECAARLERLARVSPERFEDMYVVNQVLMAEMTEKRCGRIDVDGNFIVLRPDISASLGCDIDSDGKQVLIGYQRVDLTSLPAVAEIVNPEIIRPEIVSPPEVDLPYIQIDAGPLHTCALTGEGEVQCWGDNRFNQLNDIPSGPFVEVTVGFNSACALTDEGKLSCWGSPSEFKGYDEFSEISFTQIDLNSLSSCGLAADGRVYCWGTRDWEPPPYRFSQISVNSTFGCGVIPISQDVECWGFLHRNLQKIPNGPIERVLVTPVNGYVLSPDGRVKSWGKGRPYSFGFLPYSMSRHTYEEIGAGFSDFFCGLKASGEIDCWKGRFFKHPDSPEGRFQDLYMGAGFACARTQEETVTCWGDNRYGQLEVPEERFQTLALGRHHACGITRRGELRCWGDNMYGQLNVPDF